MIMLKLHNNVSLSLRGPFSVGEKIMTDILIVPETEIELCRLRLALICSFSSMPLGSTSIKSLSREYTYREDEMTDEYACGDVARMPTSLLRRVLRWPNGKR